jgi:transcriptional regulator with XRE-family HTH domain
MTNSKTKPENSINERLKAVRKALNLTQVEFCKGIFLTDGHYAEIELGSRRVNERIIKLVEIIFNVNEGFLKTGTEPMFNLTSGYKRDKLIHIFNSLPPDFQDYALNQIEQLKKLHDGKLGQVT